tara:strand:+ start:2209 stop:3042 length:834 start_codon:yes stop_codon:yes gene_type:complete
MYSPDEKIQLIKSIAEDIEALFSIKSISDFNMPSPCSLWQVADVVAHLIGGAQRHMESLKRSSLGNVGPPQGYVVPTLDQLSLNNANRDKEIRSNVGSNIECRFKECYSCLNDVLIAVGKDDWDMPCWHARSGTITALQYLDLRVQEMVIHQWDINRSFSEDFHLEKERAAMLLSIIPDWLSATFRPGIHLSEPITYVFHLDGLDTPITTINCYGDAFEINHDSPDTPDCDVYCDLGSYVLFIYGRIATNTSLFAEKMKVIGDVNLMNRFEEWFKGL